MVKKILEYLVQKNLMEEVLVNLWFVQQIQYKVVYFVMINVNKIIKERDQCVGKNVQKEC